MQDVDCLHSQPQSHYAAHVRSQLLLQSSLWVELQHGPLLGQLDCLEYGSDGFIGHPREHSLVPLHSQQPA